MTAGLHNLPPEAVLYSKKGRVPPPGEPAKEVRKNDSVEDVPAFSGLSFLLSLAAPGGAAPPGRQAKE
jgi:hypothetical protein